jgi:hypothetical protein
MSLVIDGTGSITGLTATGISAVQNLPAGSVIQVVQGTTTTQVTTTSSSLVDTGLTASITPKFATSKILVLVSQSLAVSNSNNTFNSIGLGIIRNSTTVFFSDRALAIRAGLSGSGDVILDALVAFNYLDSPSTTSATTYKTQFRVFDTNNGSIRAQETLNTTSASSITLLEIAA